MPRILLVDDDRVDLEALAKLVEAEGFEVRAAESLAATRAALEQDRFDLVVCDLELPDGCALDLLPLIDERPFTDLVLVTGHGSVDSAVEAFRGGVVDYLTKPVDVRRLRKILANVRRAARLRGEVGELRDRLRQLGRFGRLIGASRAMQEVFDQILKVAPTSATVLVTGETGTGKELVAETLHGLGPRSERPFLPLHCGAISATLIESELFGHERGSFTGATQRHEGFFERASGGTLFLDEVTEMPLELQVKLLRALEAGEFHRIGGDKPIRVDVRVVAATNRDPREAVREGKLREDLLYRLLVFPIHLPPLRAREDDTILLASHFLAQLNGSEGTRKELTKRARERLLLHDWPGNVRELRHVIERAFILASGDLGPESLPLDGGTVSPTGAEPLGIRVGMSLAEAERLLTLATLEHCGEKQKAAQALGISLKTLYNRLQRYKQG
jgi:DNA-binding NtrC family response regulator